MLSSYGELQNTPSLLPEASIYLLAFLELCEFLAAAAFVAIYFPATDTFEVPSFVVDKTNDITQGIIEENSDFMWEVFIFGDAVSKSQECTLCIDVLVSILLKKFSSFWILENFLQLTQAVDVDQRTVSLEAKEKETKSFVLETVVPEMNLTFCIF